MNSYEAFFAQLLAKRLRDAVQSVVQQTMNGLTPDQYQQRVGAHRAYLDVLSMMDEVQAEVNAPDTARKGASP